MPNDHDDARESNLIHQAGADVYFSLMINVLIVTLHQSRAIDPAVLRENVDSVLLGLERKAPGNDSLPRVYANARERLQTTLKMIKMLDDAQRVPPAGAAG